MGDLFGGVFELLLALVFYVLPLALIARKAGRSPWLALLAIIPVIGIIVLLRELAVGAWPNERGG
ncbi:hypothetical protein [Falsiroseomonas sp.]|uniref:hypothetical protein n=1 Tax=Falsiroseomonas sp. TaxID=2870721 RepID=UPI0034A21690